MSLVKWLDKYRKLCSRRGYTCDLCSKEVFDYPRARLCAACEAALHVPTDRKCPVCGRKTVAEGICLTCKGESPTFERGFSAFVYEGLAAQAVNRLKNGERYLAYFLGERLAGVFNADTGGAIDRENTVLACVPMTERAKRDRGYNQSEELAKVLSERLDLPLRAELLVKTRETSPQKKMTGKERKENVSGAYRVHERAICRDKTVLVVDDIMTTGSTGCELARILHNAGAKTVYFLTATALPEKK